MIRFCRPVYWVHSSALLLFSFILVSIFVIPGHIPHSESWGLAGCIVATEAITVVLTVKKHLMSGLGFDVLCFLFTLAWFAILLENSPALEGWKGELL